jgi:uncharacterized protein (TIGR03790 family)
MKFIVSFFIITSLSAFSQTVPYSDVGVIVNDNSQVSVEIGNYFQNARNIPAQNMIHINAPSDEVINSVQFDQIRVQIENYLLSSGLQNSLNYLVTTKGVPLRIDSVDCLQNPSTYCASFDADIALILGPWNTHISNTYYPNPYFGKDEHFSRDTFGFYLVTRLDGYTKEDVFHLIDNSGPNTGLDPQNYHAVLDLNLASGSDSSYFVDMHLQPAYDTLLNANWNATIDYSDVPLINQPNVFAYYTTGHGPINSVDLNYTWSPGSFSSMSTCGTASTFNSTSNTSNSFLIADLIAEGCTAAHGHVNCIYFSQIFNFDILVHRYLDPIKDYNLAESYYMADRSLSSQTVIIGDPKASVFIANSASLSTLANDMIKLFPNPTMDEFKISGINEFHGGVSLSITSIDGSIIAIDEEVNEGDSFDLIVSGVYFVNVFSDGALIGTHKVIKR